MGSFSKHQNTYFINFALNLKIDIKHPKCIVCKIKRPNFNYQGHSKATYCSGCKLPDMIDIKNPKCIVCKKRASYGIPCNRPNKCVNHKENGMIKNPNSKCLIKNCNNTSEYGINRPIHCDKHKNDNDVNLVERTCPKCNQVDVIINGLCVNYCGLTEIHKSLKKNQKVKEKRVLKILSSEFKIPTEYNVRVDRDCGGKKSEEKEIGYDFGTHKVFVEVDENQHKNYCELGEFNRMRNIFSNEGGIPIIFIRYNPDNFRRDGKIQKISQKKKEEELIRWLRHYEINEPKNNLSVNYLFYNNWSEGNTPVYNIDPLNTKQYKCDDCNLEFYCKEIYEEHNKFNHKDL